jgi:uncharacterized SAM-binding protein YcdF (DUF218 family)
MARQTRKSSSRPPAGSRAASGARRRPGPLGVAARVAALLLLAWVSGFFLFVLNQAAPADLALQTQGVAVLTGGPGRLARGVVVLEAGSAERLLISGVDRSVRPQELLGAAAIPPALFRCCIDLGFDADSTRSNAEEVALWVERHGYRSLRLVTAGYHMPRARAELAARLPEGVEIIPDGVRAGLPLWAMLQEYGKFQAAWLLLRVRPA